MVIKIKPYKMNEIRRKAEGLGSMLKSIAEAGGYVPSFRIQKLKNMSALELIEILGLNEIKFYFEKPIEKERKMKMTEQLNLIELIEELNYEFDGTDTDSMLFLNEFSPLEIKSNGYASIITFFGYPIWQSENDERPYSNDEEEDLIPLKQWLEQEIVRVLEHMKQINFGKGR
jgi:hypothetical protein